MLSTALLLAAVCLVPACTQGAVCSFSGGQVPSSGACAGPLNRATARVASVAAHNYGCPLSSVPFALNNTLRCGECAPAWHGAARFTGALPPLPHAAFGAPAAPRSAPSASVPLWQCGAREYCNTQGKCADLARSPLAGAVCGAAFPCPTGLVCVRHACRVCAPGMPFRASGADAALEAAMCVGGALAARAALPFKAPEAALSAALFAVAAAALLLLACAAARERRARPSGLLMLIDDPTE